MTHCSDDDLVLHYYGEPGDAGAHVAACEHCAERARELAAVLGSVPGDVPERGELYGREVWYRIRPRLGEGAPRGVVARLAAALMRSRPAFGLRPAILAAGVVVLLGAGFLAGRVSVRPSRPAVSAPAVVVSELPDPGLARRVLLLAVADHLERSDRLLTDIMNTPDEDLSLEQQWADDLVAANRLYRQDALDADESAIAAVLDELERTLLDIVHRPSGATADDLTRIRRRVDSAALLFKVRVLTTDVRQRQLVADEPAVVHSAPPIG